MCTWCPPPLRCFSSSLWVRSSSPLANELLVFLCRQKLPFNFLKWLPPKCFFGPSFLRKPWILDKSSKFQVNRSKIKVKDLLLEHTADVSKNKKADKIAESFSPWVPLRPLSQTLALLSPLPGFSQSRVASGWVLGASFNSSCSDSGLYMAEYESLLQMLDRYSKSGRTWIK